MSADLVQAILLGLDSRPVAGLRGLPHADVALGLDVCQTRDGSVGAAQVSAINNNLVTGQQRQRVTKLLVLLHQVAEGHVVAGGVLDAGQHALGAQLGKELPGKLSVHAHGDVVREDGQVELGMQDAEMLLNLGHAAQSIERAGGDQHVGTKLLGNAAVLEDALGLGVDDADHHGNAMVDDADGLGYNLAAALIGGEDDLAEEPRKNRPSTPASIIRLMLRSKETTSSW